MQRFRFALQGVLHYRQIQFNVQRARVEELFAALQSVETQKARLEEEVSEERRSVNMQGVVEPLELLALDAFSRSAEQQQMKLSVRKNELLSSIGQERRNLLEAQRNRDLLDKVRDRRRMAWESAEAAEIDAFANEAYLSRWHSRGTLPENDIP